MSKFNHRSKKHVFSLESLERRQLLAALTIAQENALPGTPANTWDISGAGSSSLQGFATDMSVNRGNTVSFKITDTTLASYHIDIYRIGYYQGNGARLVASIGTASTIEKKQPSPITNSTTGDLDCGNWTVSASWPIPADATSGVYFARITYDSGGGASQIPFIVRNDSSTANVVFETSDASWQAYNDYGGKSLYNYQSSGGKRAYKVSYNRPFNTRGDSTEDYFFNAEYPMVRFLERNGYETSYIAEVDPERFGSSILTSHKIFVSTGHDEYWSGGQRAAAEAARSAGVNFAFLSGNEVSWKTRWENSIDGSNTAYRTLVCYKESIDDAKTDPSPQWTGMWRDPRFSPPSDGGRPENALTGTISTVNAGATTAIKVPAIDAKLRFWRNTSIASLTGSQVATLTDQSLGYEWDEDLDNGARPPGLIDMSSTTVNNAPVIVGYGDTYASGTATHSLTLYRASSGALVFGAGTVQWSWGLDANHDLSGPATDMRMQQATVNLFADMGVQPATLMSGVAAATKSTDTSAPTALISSPASGAVLQSGTAVTISGTASDTGGGVIGGVEVSTDGGKAWHPATGRGTWTYSWTPSIGGTATLMARAADDSANLQSSPTAVTVTVNGVSGQTILGEAIPTHPIDPDGTAVEIGVKFRTDVNGTITGLRFYKGGSTNSGTHIADLWSSTGTKLATATFTGESTSGWQSVKFSSAVAIKANTTYVASYYAPTGHYAEDDGYFSSSGAGSGQVHALASGVDGPNGVYHTNAGFPNTAYQDANYYVDVYFQPAGPDVTPPTVTAQSPATGATNVSPGTKVTATFSEPINQSTLSFVLKDPASNPVAGTVSYDSASNTATFTSSAALGGSTTYTVTVSGAKDLAGNTMTSTSWSFTTSTPDVTPPTVISQNPPSGATNVAVNTAVSVTFSEPVQSGTIAFTLKDAANNAVAGSVSYNPATSTATFTPASALASAAIYTATVSGAKDISGNTMSGAVSWSFTTSAAAPTLSIWQPTDVPVNSDEQDPAAVELGVKFKSDIAGYITGIRFYKGAEDTGTHLGRLWNTGGTKLADATFSGETATGWQQVNFASAVPVTAGAIYIASYFAPKGHYASDEQFFATAGVDHGTLHALKNGTSGGNGVYLYNAAGGFPNKTYKSTNYWVDVVFSTTASAPAPQFSIVTIPSPASGLRKPDEDPATSLKSLLS